MNILDAIINKVWPITEEEVARMSAKIEKAIDRGLDRSVERALANDEPDIDEDHDFDGCDFCEHPWQFRVRYPRELDGRGTALWLCKQCAEEMPLDYRPYIEVERQSAE